MECLMCVKRIWYLSPMRAAKVQASLRIRAVSPEPSLLAHTSSESRATFRQKARSLAPLNGWACAVKICHDGMLEDTNSLDGAHLMCPFLPPRRLSFELLLLSAYSHNKFAFIDTYYRIVQTLSTINNSKRFNEPHHVKTCLRDLRPVKIQIGLRSHRS